MSQFPLLMGDGLVSMFAYAGGQTFPVAVVLLD